MISHVEKIIRAVPEVESTSRRTGLQLGLAAVTEPNTGDISVKLKDNRSRGIDDIISEARSKVTKRSLRWTLILLGCCAGYDRRSHRGASTRRRETLFAGRDPSGYLGAASG